MKRKIIVSDILSGVSDGKRVGHYYALARNYQAIFGGNCKVAGGPVYKTAFPLQDLYELPYNVNVGKNPFINRFKTFVNARKLFRMAEGDCIILQQCTTITTFLCVLLFYRCKSKLFLIQYSLEGFRVRAGKWLYKLVKKKFDGLICPNEEVGRAYDIPYCVVPDYIYTGSLNANSSYTKEYETKKYDFCIIGRMSEEKGAVEVAKRFASSRYKLLIAGEPASEDMDRALHEACDGAENIDLKTDYLSDEDFAYYLQNSKYAILNYQGEYSKRSSGVVYDTLFAGLPVVGRRCKALNFIEGNEVGCLYDNLEDLNPDNLLNQNVYSKYRHNIEKYCETHLLYKERLMKFINKA